MTAPARLASERKRDTLNRLEQDVDVWVATAGAANGTPYLVPLSYLWDGLTLLIATPTSSPTARNMLATGNVRLGLGLTRDVILIEGTAKSLPSSEISSELGDAFAIKTGFDPRELQSSYTYFRIRPQRVQAWRESNELDGRDLMQNGLWTV